MDDLSYDQSGGSIFGFSSKKDKLNKLLENIISKYLQERLKELDGEKNENEKLTTEILNEINELIKKISLLKDGKIRVLDEWFFADSSLIVEGQEVKQRYKFFLNSPFVEVDNKYEKTGLFQKLYNETGGFKTYGGNKFKKQNL